MDSPTTEPPAPDMSSKAAAGWIVALLTVVVAVVWRRRQRWRRRPWLARLRAEAASKLERERANDGHRDTRPVSATSDAQRVQDALERKPKEGPVLEVRSDNSASVKRPKERRKRGKEPRGRATTSKLPADAPTPVRIMMEPSVPEPPSPHLIPLPASPVIASTSAQADLPALVLSGPSSPVSTSHSISATEFTITTPTISSTPSPGFTGEMSRSKLPAFPPASPLPPSLARKQPPIPRRPTPVLNRKGSTSSQKGSLATERKASSDQVEFSWPRVEDDRPKKQGRKDSVTPNGRGRKPSDVKRKGTPESTQIASLKGALEAARIREEEVVEERKAWQKRERELQAQVNQLSHQLQSLSMVVATGSAGGWQMYGYGHIEQPAAPSVPASVSPNGELPNSSHLPTPASDSIPLPPNPLMPSALMPSQPSIPYHPIPYSHPYMAPMPVPPHSPMAPGPHPSMGPGPHPQMIHIPSPMQMQMPTPSPMSPPHQHSTMSPTHGFVSHPWMQRSPMHRHTFYTGSPRRSHSPYILHPDRRQSTPSVGSTDGRASTGSFEGRSRVGSFEGRPGLELRPSIGQKREREPETESESSSEESDDDSVIFEDGSVTDSLNLSLLSETFSKEPVDMMVKLEAEEVTP